MYAHHQELLAADANRPSPPRVSRGQSHGVVCRFSWRLGVVQQRVEAVNACLIAPGNADLLQVYERCPHKDL